MDTLILMKGIAVGMAVAAPLGPVGFLCIQRSLTTGYISGIVAGLGAATADAVYGGIAAFGLTAVATFLTSHQAWIRIAGGILLCLFGARMYFEKPAEREYSDSVSGLVGTFSTTLVLTLTNPITLFALTGIFVVLELDVSMESFSDALVLVAGIFAGSMLWWILLSSGAHLFRSRISIPALGVINRILGIGLFAFGFAALWRGIGIYLKG